MKIIRTLAVSSAAVAMVLGTAGPGMAVTLNTGSGSCGGSLVRIQSETLGYSNQRAFLTDDRVILYEKGYRSYANRYVDTRTSWATLAGATAYGSEYAYYARLAC